MTRQTFLKLLAKYGATLDSEAEDYGTLTVDAPRGKVFLANDCHCMCEAFENRGGQSWKAEAYKLMAERLSYGLADCEDADCEHCN